MVFNYKLTIEYDGTLFYGYQSQVKERNVSDELEKAITRLNSQEKVKLIASGRTDAKVHAKGQVVTFKSTKEFEKQYFLFSINRLLPDDIYAKDFEIVANEFHPRFNAKAKHYQYKINTKEYNVFKKNYELQYCKPINILKMIEASKHLIGKKDFRTFSSATINQNSIKEIHEIRFKEESGILIIDFYGTGFLRYMIRKLVSILLDVAQENKSIEEMLKLLNKKQISAYSKIAPGCGLYLIEVSY
ncbi:tRNA pseudouridine(38-40) synthase TruA [Mycoplasma sp. P36-A1]|uniref:tRNA pseudouridine(38-40) synthase TruA n=1 Tax=Mycoplasma sp. P36-A1 TaxID=3252900 RepID=UPI003C2CC570